VEDKTGVRMGLFHWDPTIADLAGLFGESFVSGDGPAWLNVPAEIVLIPMLLLIAVAVGLLPAFTAYRTDVAKSLGK
jgi:putative ABC transport system permease protein